MPISFENRNLGLGRKDIKFSGDVAGQLHPIICSIDRNALAVYCKVADATCDKAMASAFDSARTLIVAVAAAQWRAGNNRPRIGIEDLTSFPRD